MLQNTEPSGKTGGFFYLCPLSWKKEKHAVRALIRKEEANS